MHIFVFVALFFGAFGVIEERDRDGSCLRSVSDDRLLQEYIPQENFTPSSMIFDENLSAYDQRRRDTAQNDAEGNENGAPTVGGGAGDGDEEGDDSGCDEGPQTSHKSEQSLLQLHVMDAVGVNTEWLQRTTEAVTGVNAEAGAGMEAGMFAAGTDPEAGEETGAGTQTELRTGTIIGRGTVAGIGNRTRRMTGNWTGTGTGTVTGKCAGAETGTEEEGRPTGFQTPPGDFHVNVEVPFPGQKRILTAKDATWQNVSGTKHKFFVYSAFYDRRGNRTVRIVGASKLNDTDHVWCRLWYKADDTHHDASGGVTNQSCSIVVPAEVRICNENHKDPYSAVFVLCALGRKLAAPTAVSVVSSLHRPPANLLLVRNTDADLAARNLTAGPVGGQSPLPRPVAQAAKSISAIHAPDTIAVCIKPLHSKYNKTLRILEFIELNAILGVQHFVMYNLSVGDQVSCVLRDYIERGIVTLLSWELDMSKNDIHSHGQVASQNDCLYRSMYKYKYTALLDVDEFIISRNQPTLQDLIVSIDTHAKTHDVGSYSFQNVFFYHKLNDDPGLQGINLLERHLLILRKTRKSLDIYPHRTRSKYICRPEFVVEAGIHFVFEFVPGHRTFNVKPNVAFLHHYRFCKSGGDDCITTASVVDEAAYGFRERLVRRVCQRYSKLQLRCDLPPLECQPEEVSKAVSREEYAALLSLRISALGNLLFKIGLSLMLLLI